MAPPRVPSLFTFYKHRLPSPGPGTSAVGVRDLTWISGTELHPEQHVVGRLFYPTQESRWWPICFWLPHRYYAWGYANSLLFTMKGFKYAVIRALLHGLIYCLGSTTALDYTYNATLTPALPEPEAEAGDGAPAGDSQPANNKLPVIIFSHGLVGNRSTYSTICGELASKGYVVFAIEHADGTASATRLARSVTNHTLGVKGGWRYYSGWASNETTYARTRWRVKEVLTAHKLLTAMAQGEHVPGLHISGLQPSRPDSNDGSLSRLLPGSSDKRCTSGFFAGRLDMGRTAVVGHSYGGATAAMAASEHSELGAAVCLDPWWEALPPECAALNGRWLTRAPVLIIGSHDWNTPNAAGKLFCGGPEQLAVLAAAAKGAGGGVPAGGAVAVANGSPAAAPQAGGPGALLLVPKGSTHHSFDDVLLFFGGLFQALLKLFKFHAALSAERALDITTQATQHFLSTHLGSDAPALPFQAHHAGYYRQLLGPDLAILTESFAQ